MSAAQSALSRASFALFLESMPMSTSPQGCFLSPLSIVYALSLAMNGAGPKSATHSELLSVIAGGPTNAALSEAELNSELGRAMTLLNSATAAPAGEAGPYAQMILANSLWTARGTELKKEYVDAMQSLYQATARVAANGAKDINAWVANKTMGMIRDLISSDDFDAVLASAIYFKGMWSHAFKKHDTHPRDFTTAAGVVKKVDMMSNTFESRDGIQALRKEDFYDAVALPYKGGAYSAIALLPAPGVDMAAAIRDFGAAPPKYEPVHKLLVWLPKFTVSSSLSLTPVLQQLGVQAAFGGGADFSRMAAAGLHISDVVHKAVVEVDEEGTVAAAATAMMLSFSMPQPPPELKFNRPFAFIIHHRPTGLPTFIGVVNDPSSA